MTKDTVKELYGPPKVGGDTLAYCTKCKIELSHVIVSMLDTKPAKVVCKTCKSQHNYKRIGDLTTKKASKPRAPRAAKTPPMKISEVWEKKMAESKAAPQPYSMKSTFKKGDLIEHTKFGPGLIQDARADGKIVVLFRDAERILIHVAPQA